MAECVVNYLYLYLDLFLFSLLSFYLYNFLYFPWRLNKPGVFMPGWQSVVNYLLFSSILCISDLACSMCIVKEGLHEEFSTTVSTQFLPGGIFYSIHFLLLFKPA